jgi:hypothetical protein
MALDSLKARWKQKTGEDMPDNIASLPLDRIRRAVEMTEKGITVVVPKAVVAVEAAEESMVAWDRHKEF